LKTRIFRKYLFHKLTQFSQGNNGHDAAASNKDDLSGEIHVFKNSAEWAYFEQNELFSTLKIQIFRMYSFQKRICSHREAMH
jgi:hypothetical protein